MTKFSNPAAPVSRGKKIGLTALLLLVITIFLSCLYVFINLSSLPHVDKQALTTYPPTKIVAKNGEVIWQPTDKRAIALSYNQLPTLYRQALVQTEDADFWHNHGYSPKGVANAVVTTILSKINPYWLARGGSSIEQQLIKNVYFDGGIGIKTTTRKIQEIYLAQQLDHNFSKRQILAFYANHIEFGEGDTGVGAIMMTYFGKKPSDYQKRTPENIAEQAYLAGLGQAPTAYSLYDAPKVANSRKDTVLKIMYDAKLISASEYDKALNYDLTKNRKPRFWEANQQRAKNRKYKAYTDQVLNEVAGMGYNIEDVSMTVHTFLDPKVYNAVTNKVRQNGYYQDGNTRAKNKEQVGATIINHDGLVVAMVGSRTPDSEVNRAVQRTRSSGSSAKPFTAYGPLFEYLGNRYNTASIFSSSAYRYPGSNEIMYNYGKVSMGMVTLPTALRQSLNTVVGRIDDQVLGSSRMKTFLHGVGLDVKNTYSSVDGIGLNISTLDAAAAYNAINNNGIYTKPRFVAYLKFPDGSKKTIKPQRKRAMKASVAFVLSQMMRGVMTHSGTAPAGAISNYSGYAGKTGTVAFAKGLHIAQPYGEGGSDAWFDTITKNGYSVSVWMGYDKPNSSPAVADRWTGTQRLGRDLQLYLNGNKYLPNWSRPRGVKLLSGSNLSAQYAVTNSQDIGQKNAVIAKLNSAYHELGKTQAIQPSAHPGNWTSKIKNKDLDLFSLFDDNPNLINDVNVIDSDFYDLLHKTNNIRYFGGDK